MSRLYAQILGERLSGTPHLPGSVAAPEPSVSGASAACKADVQPVELVLNSGVLMILRLAADAERLSFDEVVSRAIVQYAESLGMPKLLNADWSHGCDVFDEPECLTDVPRFARAGERRFGDGA